MGINISLEIPCIHNKNINDYNYKINKLFFVKIYKHPTTIQNNFIFFIE